jgi:cytochrome c oxidase assembly factor CtaG/ferredoxin
MNPTLDACLRSWPWAPWLLATCLLSAAAYFRGWRYLRGRDRERWSEWRLAAFFGGVLAIYLALASPIEPLSSLLLQVHMIQHLLLIMVSPPLVLLSAPLLPVLCGLPKSIRAHWIAPFMRSADLRRFARRLTHPATALALFVTTNLLWHVPANYELALRSSGWHYLQHVCFLVAGILFWFPVIRPYPSRPRWSAWLLLPCLFLADVQNTVLSAWFTFSSKILYPYYAQVPRIGNISPLEDQTAAGVIMWVPGSVAFLLPLAWIGVQLLYGSTTVGNRRKTIRSRPGLVALPRATSQPFYSLPVLNSAGLGSAPIHTRSSPLIPQSTPPSRLATFLRWRHARLTLQVPLLLVAAVVIYDGLRGPVASPMNLAGVLPWIHWRGLVVFGLLAVGNLSCMVCPFTLPRTLAGRWLPRQRHWPRALQSKWLAVALVALFLWAYEAFALWASPWWTAWITIGYFVVAFAVDGLFRGAAFCKYVCPIGQFNFVQSLVSPLEIAVRNPQTCATCHTKDCIRGRDGIPGCELNLFQPRKAGNMDCTFCLNCIQACPHSNVGFVASVPGSQLWHDRFRSGIGRLRSRPDIAMLTLVLVFGSCANAAGMVGPVVEWEQQLQATLGLSSARSIVTIYYLLALLVAPLASVGMASELSRRWADLPSSSTRIATRYAYSLIPLGFGMWLAHYGFHLLTSYETIVPTVQRFAADFGLSGLGAPRWNCACCKEIGDWVVRLELVFLDFGFLLSLYTAYRLAQADSQRTLQTFRTVLPWSALITLLFLLDVWIVFQPMQMRGTMSLGQ